MQHRHFVFVLMSAMAMSSATGQEPEHSGQRPPPPAETARQLGLDAARASQFVQIMEDQRAKRHALRQQADADRAAMRQKMDALHEETRARLRSVLNAEQLAQFEQLRPRPPGPPPRQRDGAPPERR